MYGARLGFVSGAHTKKRAALELATPERRLRTKTLVVEGGR